MKRALVIGSGGQVARAVIASLRARGAEVVTTSSSGKPGSLALDLGDAAGIRNFFAEFERSRERGGWEVILPGAMTHVDKCEAERDLCRRVNAEGPVVVAEECKRLGYGLTYFSTEYVFGGDEYEGGRVGPFSEEDPPHPTCWYGGSKLEAERGVLRVLPSALAIRTTMIFSWDPAGMNFLMQYLRHLDGVRAGKTDVFKIPQDQISTPTYAPALGEAAVELRERGVSGIVNVVGEDLLSRRELVERVIDFFGYDREKSLRGFTFLNTKDLGQAAKRPLTAGLKADKARALGLRIWTLDEAFRDVKRQQQSR